MSIEELLKPRYKGYIYKILCTANNKFYIGSTQNIIKRKSDHFVRLLKGVHYNKSLQNSYNKYGLSAFEFSIIDEFEFNIKLEILKKEQEYLDELNPKFNVYPIAGSPLGCKRVKHSEESKRKMSLANKGVKKSAVHRAILSVAQSKRDNSTRNTLALKKFLPGADNYASRKVINEDTGELFFTLTDASNSIGIKLSYLSGMLHGHFKNKTKMKFI